MKTQYRKVTQYLKLIWDSAYCNRTTVENISTMPCDYKKDNTLPSLENFVPFKSGDEWGFGSDQHAWFHFELDIPEHMRNRPVQLIIRSDFEKWVGTTPQFMLYVDGVYHQGMDTQHTFFNLDTSEKFNFDIYVYAYTSIHIKKAKFFAEIRNVNIGAEALAYDIEVPFNALNFLSDTGADYANILRHLDKAVSMLDLYELGSDDYFASVERARKYMQDEFYGKFCGRSSANVACVGHTHIDYAWLWTISQTKEKVQRSFATVLELMERYPNYKFMSSQPLLYRDFKENAPELYEKIKERIREGRWECEGAMWVEADCNLTSGESLIRQLIYGKRFFREEFGKESRVLWLPDVFGYSAALPQILRKCGVDWFVTSKISWNDSNMMPYDTFSWQGIDGTAVNTYFLTAQKERDVPVQYCTYNADLTTSMIAGTWHRYQQKNLNNEAMITYGYGDGGGGPSIPHLETAERLKYGIPGVPSITYDNPTEFLGRLEKNIENNPLLPKWQGELYLEYHRGTYTSIAKMKRNNRKSEFLYQNAEWLASMGRALCGKAFPKASLREGWEEILKNQFHDIIPGSSVAPVYDDADRDYVKIKAIANDIIADNVKNIADNISESNGYVIFNPNAFDTDGYVEIDGKTAFVKNIPAKGYVATTDIKTDNNIMIGERMAETSKLLVTFDEAYQITSIYDKENDRELIKKGSVGNEIRVYPDHPDCYDNWEWQEYSLEEYKTITALSSVETIDDGARKGIKLVRPFMDSTITQTIWFYDKESKIDFDTVADWHRNHLMVKAAFGVDINSGKATYEIQYGNIERPNHKNTSWDRAKFEVCAHKYADLSDGGYGVSLMNDCKYGYDIHDGVMQLSLFKSGTYPSKGVDHGEIPFVYSLYLHKGTFAESDTIKQAYLLNNPLFAVKASGTESSLPERYSMVSCDKANVLCDVIKEAEEGTETVLRLYECKNIRTKATIKLGFDAKKCYLCDMLEREISELEINDGSVKLDLSGFEIVTLKLK